MSGNSILASIEKLDGTNYHVWKKEVQAYLMMEDLWEAVDPDTEWPTGVTARNQWNKRDQKAYGAIYFSTDPAHCEPISAVTSGREAWKILKNEHEKDTPSSRMILRQQFYAVSHDASSSVSKFLSDVLSIVRQLEAINRKPTEEEICDKILIGLDTSFSAVRTSLAVRQPSPSLKEIMAAV